MWVETVTDDLFIRQHCLFVTCSVHNFYGRSSRCSQVAEGITFIDHRNLSLVFANDVELLALSNSELHFVLSRFAAKCKAARMKMSSSKNSGHGSG